MNRNGICAKIQLKHWIFVCPLQHIHCPNKEQWPESLLLNEYFRWFIIINLNLLINGHCEIYLLLFNVLLGSQFESRLNWTALSRSTPRASELLEEEEDSSLISIRLIKLSIYSNIFHYYQHGHSQFRIPKQQQQLAIASVQRNQHFVDLS